MCELGRAQLMKGFWVRKAGWKTAVQGRGYRSLPVGGGPRVSRGIRRYSRQEDGGSV